MISYLAGYTDKSPSVCTDGGPRAKIRISFPVSQKFILRHSLKGAHGIKKQVYPSQARW